MDQPLNQGDADTDIVLELVGTEELPGVTTLECAAQQVVFGPDDSATNVFHLLSGEVRVSQSLDGAAERLVSIHGRGSWIGLAPLIGLPIYGFRAIAHRPSTIVMLPAAAFFKLIDSSPQLASEVIRQLASRLIKSSTAATRQSSKDSNTRIIETLLELGNSAAGERHDNSVVVHLTHQELAKAVGLARETVSVALTAFRDHQLIWGKRRQLTFNPEALRQFVASGRAIDKQAKPHACNPEQ